MRVIQVKANSYQLILCILYCIVPASIYAADYTVEKWNRVDITLTSTEPYTNPDTDVNISATFTAPDDSTITLPGFWDGGRTWKVRFAPTQTGEWSYTITCSDTTNTGLNKKTGTIQCNSYTGDVDTYTHGFVKISSDNRYFVYDDGTPFFWLGDTHWQMPNYERLDECNYPSCSCGSQFEHVVNDRKSKGFTVYQTYPDSAMNDGGGNVAEVDWWNTQYTHLNPQAFKDQFDPMMNYLADNGFTIALGMGVHKKSDDMGSTAFQHFTKYMVARYASYPVVWITGQEVDLGDLNIWEDVATTINQYDGYNHPLTGHMKSSGKPTTWGTKTWHDWWATQGGHLGAGIRTQAHYKYYWYYTPTKPYLETEAMYENLHARGTTISTKNTRISAWKALQCGSYGYTYGVAGVWAMKWDYTVTGWNSYNNGIPWFDGINKPGSTQMNYLKEFYEYVGFNNLTPRFGSATWGTFNNTEKSVLSSNGSDTYVVYFYDTATSTGALNNMNNSATYSAKWFNPRTGVYTLISGSISPSSGQYKIPSKPDADDWVLLVTNQSLGAEPKPAPTPTPTPAPTPTHTPTPVPVNIALNKTATASSDNGSPYLPSKAVDGNVATLWCPTDGTFPQWLKVDLGSLYSLGTVKQRFHDDDNSTFYYKIEGSTDNTNWTVLADRTNTGRTGQTFEESVSGTYRYVRLTVTNATNSHWASSDEFEVYESTGVSNANH